jgi:hypothetical protein
VEEISSGFLYERIETRLLPRRVFIQFSGLALGASVLSACSGSSSSSSSSLSLPVPPCRDKPQLPDLGPPASRSEQTTIELHLSLQYLREQVMAAFPPPPSSTSPPTTSTTTTTPSEFESGLMVKEVTLHGEVLEGQTTNLIEIRANPWIRADSGEIVEWPIPIYRLRFKLVPYFIGQSTIQCASIENEIKELKAQLSRLQEEFRHPTRPKAEIAADIKEVNDQLAKKNKELNECLTKTDETRTILRLEFYELINQSNGNWRVDCSKHTGEPLIDYIDFSVLNGIYEKLSTKEAQQATTFAIPSGALVQAVQQLTGQKGTIDGINLATPSDQLVLGFKVKDAPSHPFIEATPPPSLFSHHPSEDWAFGIDTKIVKKLAKERVKEKAKEFPAIKPIGDDDIDIDFIEEGIEAKIRGTLSVCPNTVPPFGSLPTLDARTVARINVCSSHAPEYQSTLTICMGAIEQEVHTAGAGQAACVSALKILGDIWQFFSELFSGSVPLEPEACSPLGEPIGFKISEKDHFYPSGVDTNYRFALLGRSSFMDTVVGSSRRPVPLCPGQPSPPKCASIAAEIKELEKALSKLQQELQHPQRPKSEIMADIAEVSGLLAQKRKDFNDCLTTT